MDWIERFIDTILAEVPKSRYRTRTEKELRDHMETQYRVLAEGGWTPQEAQEEILRTMGETDRLRKEYEDAWKRSPRTWVELVQPYGYNIFFGCIIMGAVYIFTVICLGYVLLAGPSVDLTEGGPSFFRENPWYLFSFCSVVFGVPFGLGALYLRFAMRDEHRPILPVTLGLLAAWTGEKAAIIGLSALIYGMLPGPALLTRIYCGGDVTAPWFTPGYIVLTFLGCLLLGQLFGRLPAGKNRRQTA